jgi:D-alanyl-D-alanine carboxypeptidase (penicillin-binding protein 5/6)
MSRAQERSLRLVFAALVCAAIAVGVWLGLKRPGVAPEDDGGPNGLPLAPSALPVAQAPAAAESVPTKFTLAPVSTWTFDGAVVADTLPVKQIDEVDAGILVDADTGRILWSKHSHRKEQIASMTKMMTALLAIEQIEQGRVSPAMPVVTSKAAARIGGSQVYLKEGETFTLAELLQSIMIHSANDSAHAVAEALSGSVGAFVTQMNARAAALGMRDTHYYNVHGLPLSNGENISSAYDSAILARELLKHPRILEWSSTWITMFRDNTFQMVNHNRLVKDVPGVDGLKTGYYKKAGFCVTFTVKREGRRLIGVLIGVDNKTVRNAVAEALIDWGYQCISDQSAVSSK